MSKVLILGHTGLIGSALFSFLSTVPHYEVFGLDRSDCDFSQSSNLDEIRSVFTKIDPDIVIVLSAIKRQDSDTRDTLSANNSISDNIAVLLAETSSRVVYVSSCAVYGEKNTQKDFTEESPVKPTSDYGFHKQYSESIYSSHIAHDKLLIIRPPMIYNPRICKSYGPSLFLNQALNDKQITMWGDGSEYRELIHTNDVCYIIYRLIEDKAHSTINLVSGISYNYASIASFISSLLSVSIISRERSIPTIVNHSYNPATLYSYLPIDYRFLTPQQAILNALL